MRQVLFKLTVRFCFTQKSTGSNNRTPFDFALSNRQVGGRHKTFCSLWWLIRDLEGERLGWIPLLGLRLLVCVSWVEARRRITLTLKTAMVSVPNWDSSISSGSDLRRRGQWSNSVKKSFFAATEDPSCRKVQRGKHLLSRLESKLCVLYQSRLATSFPVFLHN